MRRFLTLLIPSFVLLLLPTSLAQAQDQLDCPDASLTSYLVALIDALYADGLTTFEQLLATIAETDSGYDLLDSWYSDQALTLLAPTDAAFQAADIHPPFAGMSESAMTHLVALHTLTGMWTYDKLPESPLHAIAETGLGVQGYMNSSTKSEAHQAMVLQRGDGGAVSVRMANGNGTTWSGPIDVRSTPQLSNLALLPVDTLIGYPPKLSSALTLPTTSRSADGLLVLSAALGKDGGATKLEALTEKGFTIFAPVDDAWTDGAKTGANDTTTAKTLLANHYTTKFSMYSGFYTDSGSYNLTMDSGLSTTSTYNSSGSFVELGDVTARILRADVPVENGVMHIIDQVLMSPTSSSSSSSTPSSVSPAGPVGGTTKSAGDGNPTAAAAAADGAGATSTGSASGSGRKLRVEMSGLVIVTLSGVFVVMVR